MGTLHVVGGDPNRQNSIAAIGMTRSERGLSIDLLCGIGNVIVEPRCECATVDKDVATFRTGLIRQIDFGVRAPPVVLLGESTCHLPRNALQPPEAGFQEAQHLPMDVVPLIPNRDTRELVIHRNIEDTGHLSSGKGCRRCLGKILDDMRACPDCFQVLAGGQRSSPRNIMKSFRVVGHGNRPCRADTDHGREHHNQRPRAGC